MAELAGHLPGLAPDAIARRRVRFAAHGATVSVDLPVLGPQQSEALAAHVRQHAGAYLRQKPVSEIVATIDQAIARLLDRDDPWRRRAETILPVVTGYDRETVRLALTSYLRSFRAPQLRRFLAEDFTNPLMLDGFQPAKGGFARACPPGLLLHVWAGNVPGLPLWSLIGGLLVKAGSIGKAASAEPLMAGWFAELLAEIDPQLGQCLAVVWWQGGDETAERGFLRHADTVLAYGGNDSLAAIRQRLPVTTRFLPHGHKLGFAVVSTRALDRRRAAQMARLCAQDVTRYEQQGCYSPQAVFVARGGIVSPRDFAGMLARELAGLATRHPRRALSIAERAALAQWRSGAELSGADLLGDPGGDWSVAFHETPTALAPSALNRSVAVIAVDDLDAVPALVAPLAPFLQSAGVAASPEELFTLADRLAAIGVTRIAAIGAMGVPEAGWHHDGRFSLLDLVTIAEIDGAAEAAAEGFAPYAD